MPYPNSAVLPALGRAAVLGNLGFDRARVLTERRNVPARHGGVVNSALLICLVVLAGLVGAVVGSFQRAAIGRVPARMPRRPVVEAATAVAFAAVTAVVLTTRTPSPGMVPVLLAFLWFAAVGIALAVIDVDTHRLPDAIVLPSYVVAGVLFAAAAVLEGSGESLLRAVLGGALLFAFYLVLRLIQPRGMGMGDVKLAGLIGLHLAWIGWAALLVGALAAFVLGGLFGVVLLLARRARLASAIPFGPWMLAGAWVGVLTGEALGRGYGGPHV